MELLRGQLGIAIRTVGSAVLFSAVLARPSGALDNSEQNVVRALDDAEMRRETRLAGFSVVEHYTVTSSRFNLTAEMTVETQYRRGEGESHRIVSRTGSPMLQSRVFDRLLREEEEMTRGETRLHLLANSENYAIQLIGEDTQDGRKCHVLALTPKVNSAHLLKGRAWTNEEDGSLIRLEGVPTANSSFWIGRPLIQRDYQKVGDFWLVRRSHAVSNSLLFGRSELSIDYEAYNLSSPGK